MTREGGVFLLLENLLVEFSFYDRSRGLSDKTVVKHKKHIKMFTVFLKEMHNVSELEQVTTAHIREFLISLLEQGKAGSYVNSHLRSIRALYVFCEADSILLPQNNPCQRVQWVKEKKPLIEGFSDTEVKAMIKEAGKLKQADNCFQRFLSERNKFMIMLLFDTAIRINELCQIKSVDFLDDTILIKHAKGNKQRVVYASNKVVRQCFKYVRTRNAYLKSKELPSSEYLFITKDGNQLTVDSAQRVISKIGKQAGVRDSIRCSPHTFRHTASQSLLRNGANILELSRILGHEQIRTSEIYVRSLDNSEVIKKTKHISPLTKL